MRDLLGHRRHLGALALVTLCLALVGCVAMPFQSAPVISNKPIPRYQHIFLIVMENHDYGAIIGAPGAPHLNALANKYGLATNYWAITHPSEPNYIALVGGSTHDVEDDASYTVHQINAPYLGSQLEAAGLTWKTYQQGMPSAGFTGTNAASDAGVYASKHNPFLNYLAFYPASERSSELAKMVPSTQLATDLASGAAPNFSFIVPGLCDDMHGDTACGSADLVSAGDTFVNKLVQQIQASTAWTQGRNAIIITWDEGSVGLSFPPANLEAEGGHVATIVIPSHGKSGVQDNTPYDHYSLLLSIQQAFGLGCLEGSCPSAVIHPMSALLAN